MRIFLFTACLVLISFGLKASHTFGSYLQISHISNFDHEIKLLVFKEPTGLPNPLNVNVQVTQREGAVNIASYALVLDTSYIGNSSAFACGGVPYLSKVYEYTLITQLSPTVFNHPGGYLFSWSTCCNITGIINIMNPANSGHTGLTLFPAVADSSGNQFINNSPILNNPINDFGYELVPHSRDFGGFDPDGDSLSFELFTPIDQSVIGLGLVTTSSFPYVDPATQFAPHQWAPGYNVDDQIHGSPGPNPSPNRLKIDSQSGIITLTPGANSMGIYLFGVLCKEYRNGQLIGSYYRNVATYIQPSQNFTQNLAPEIQVPQNQALANWSGDTLIFTGSTVCVQLNITDPDTIADVSLQLIQSDYDSQDISIVQSSAIINNNDTFSTAICFSPDTFLSYSSKVDVLAFDNLCYNLKSDTLSFWFKFSGYSNAGIGGDFTFSINQNQSPINLFSLLQGNPNPGGVWVDVDNSSLLNVNNQFVAQNVLNPSTYRFQYIDQQPNYPADTADLVLSFIMALPLREFNELPNTRIFPNPSNGVIILEVSEALVGKTASVYTLESQEVQRFHLDSNTNSISIKKSGMYLIKIDGNSQVHKVFIEK